jgi:hypothetical protein
LKQIEKKERKQKNKNSGDEPGTTSKLLDAAHRLLTGTKEKKIIEVDVWKNHMSQMEKAARAEEEGEEESEEDSKLYAKEELWSPEELADVTHELRNFNLMAHDIYRRKSA